MSGASRRADERRFWRRIWGGYLKKDELEWYIGDIGFEQEIQRFETERSDQAARLSSRSLLHRRREDLHAPLEQKKDALVSGGVRADRQEVLRILRGQIERNILRILQSRRPAEILQKRRSLGAYSRRELEASGGQGDPFFAGIHKDDDLPAGHNVIEAPVFISGHILHWVLS